MEYEKTTPLDKLPQDNNDDDTDLVNKILTQLEDTSFESEIPTDESYETSRDNRVDKDYRETRETRDNRENRERRDVRESRDFRDHRDNRDHRDEENNPEYFARDTKRVRFDDELMPTPKRIQEVFQIGTQKIDIQKLYTKIKLSCLTAILFFVFIMFSNTLKKWIVKIPLTTITNFGTFNNTGNGIQALLFGISFFVLSCFVNEKKNKH
jgi:hypothetical protein